MRDVIEQLPKAIRWSNILMWFSGIGTVLLLIATIFILLAQPIGGIMLLIVTLFVGVQFWMIRTYKRSCVAALGSEQSHDVEQACRAQSRLVKFYGILSLVMILLTVIALFSIAIPAYHSYIQRVEAAQMQQR